MIGTENRSGKIAIGGWTYTRSFDHLSETVTNSAGTSAPVQGVNSGIYSLVDVPLSEHISFFNRYGVASPQLNQVFANHAIGFSADASIFGRAKDVFGIGMTRVYSSAVHRDAQKAAGVSLTDEETAYEISYRFYLGSGVTLQPDVQWIKSPSFSTTIPDATITYLRLGIFF